jgi:hypothetical protein
MAGDPRHHCQSPNRDELKIERSLLILHEASIEGSATTLMTCVAGGDRKAARKRRLVPRCLRPDRFRDRTVQSATPLLQVLTGPIIRQRDSKTSAVRLAIRASASIEDTVHNGSAQAIMDPQRHRVQQAPVPPPPSPPA